MNDDEFMTFDELKRLDFVNSKRCPDYIKFTIDGITYYRERLGIGWIECKENNKAVLIKEARNV